jgi:hypothetical protein
MQQDAETQYLYVPYGHTIHLVCSSLGNIMDVQT